MAHRRWTQKDIPSQRGKTILTTGLGELGYECALALSLAGGYVIIADPSEKAGERAVSRIKAFYSAAKVEHDHVELSNLESIGKLADRLALRRGKIDILVNAANAFTPATRHSTTDGLELQFGANYIGHFALTAKLMPLLRRAARPRVVSLSSVMALGGRINFDDLQAEAEYRPLFAYCQSKLACLIFAQELQRRSDAMDWGITSLAAHTGILRTELLHNAPGRLGARGLARSYLWLMSQPAARGALPTLFAATSPSARAGGFYGPDGVAGMRGFPTELPLPDSAGNLDVAARLWNVSETLSGISFGMSDIDPVSTNQEI